MPAPSCRNRQRRGIARCDTSSSQVARQHTIMHARKVRAAACASVVACAGGAGRPAHGARAAPARALRRGAIGPMQRWQARTTWQCSRGWQRGLPVGFRDSFPCSTQQFRDPARAIAIASCRKAERAGWQRGSVTCAGPRLREALTAISVPAEGRTSCRRQHGQSQPYHFI